MRDIRVAPPERGLAAERSTAQRQDTSPWAHILDMLPVGAAEEDRADEQLTALVAATIPNLKPEAASWLLSWFDEGFRAEVALRAALRGRFIPQTIDRLSALLRQKLIDGGHSNGHRTPAMLSALMNDIGSGPRRAILETIDAIDAEMGREAREAVFDFDDIMSLDDETLERLLRRTKVSDLGLALQGASEDLQSRVMSLRSARSARILQEEITLCANADPETVTEVRSRIAQRARRARSTAKTASQKGAA